MVRLVFLLLSLSSPSMIADRRMVLSTRQGHHWIFNPSWIKNAGQGECRTSPHLYPIPIYLNPFIRYYIDKVRPSLCQTETNAFWINKKGLPISDDTCRRNFVDLTQRMTDCPLHIRDLRLLLNSHYHQAGPHSASERKRFNHLLDHTEATAKEYCDIWEGEEGHRYATSFPNLGRLIFFSYFQHFGYLEILIYNFCDLAVHTT